jgi:Flp pilus assembly pilin Flp
MAKSKFWKKAQSMTEYAVIIAAVAAALVAMGVYFKGSLQKRLWDMSKELEARPYWPRQTSSSATSSAQSSSSESYAGGVSTTTYNETSTRGGSETVEFK